MFSALHSGSLQHDIKAKVMMISIVKFALVFFLHTVLLLMVADSYVSASVSNYMCRLDYI